MNKKIIIIVISILLLAGGADLILKNIKKENQNQFKEETPVNGEKMEDILETSTTSISQTDSFYNIQAEYPQFKGVDAGFNQKISDLITQQMEIFKKDARDNWEARRATAPPDNPIPENPSAPFDFIAGWTPTQLNNEYISFIVDIYYFGGGAHGITQLDTFNYDLGKKKEITMTDFLGSSPEGLEKLAKLASETVTTELQSAGLETDDNIKQMIEQGTQAALDNYKNFNFNSGSLIIYFQQYQVAPGYLGPVAITLSKNILTDRHIISDYLK